jgi:hypothetical protein
LRQLVEKTTSKDAHNREEEFGAGDDEARSIRTIVLHESERFEEEDED